ASLRQRLGGWLESRSPSVKTHKLAQMLQTDGSLATVFPLTRQFFAPRQIQALLNPTISLNGYDPYVALLQNGLPDIARQARHIISQISYAEISTYMHDVLLRDTDQMSMASALEVRVPFLDHRLVEYVMSLPDKQKFQKGQQKPLLVDAFSDLLPPEVINVPKQGFIMPFEAWMRGPLREMCSHHLNALSQLPAFNGEAVQQLWIDFSKGSRTVSWCRLWLLVALGAWVERQGIQ
ncbi:MAG: hypothetical protein KDD02_27070, partial [Phaeodactylibacter sp.]|nr:hypothetical protein [Phaeodactylibacter sp.]